MLLPQPSEAASRQTALGRALADAIAVRGPITFADYMQIALYEPASGYYTVPAHDATRQGWAGDYITSTDLHPLFGAAIGRQISQVWRLLGSPDPFVVLEDGAGRGHLARDIHAWAHDVAGDAPEGFVAALRYNLRDVSVAGGQRVWGATDVGADTPPHVILSNELIDAFPVHIIERVVAGWAEVYVTASEAPPLLAELLGPLSSPMITAYLDCYDVRAERFPLGWRCEVNLVAEEWMAAAAQHLAPAGVVITIDYGAPAADLYSTERHKGTLICYRSHTLSDQPLAFTGEQDITAHVNFTALSAVGTAYGLATLGFVNQRDFLTRLGIRTDARALGQRLYPRADTERHTDAGQSDYLRRSSLQHTVGALLAPQGLGGFGVLIQGRGLPDGGTTLLGLQSP